MTFRKRQETIRDFDLMRRTTCCNCPTGCGVKVFLKDQKIVDIFGDEEHPTNKGSFCPKGLLSYYHLTNPNRIIEPHIRDSLDKPFNKVSWDEAISYAGEKIQQVVKTHGKDSIFIHASETDPFGYITAGSLFAEYFGTADIGLPLLSSPFKEGDIKKMFGVTASQLLMNSPRDWCSSRCILLYGCDLAASDPITFGPIVDARDRGTTLLSIDSKKTITTSKATLSLRVKPGTHSTALKGILNLLIQKGCADEAFLKESTADFSILKSNVERFTPDAVAKACWINKKDLEQMAELIAKVKPIQVIAGDWSSRRRLSNEDLYMCAAIICLRGSIGIPGGGLNLLNVSPFLSLEPAEKDKMSYDCLENILMDPDKKPGALISYGNSFSMLANGEKTKTSLRNIPFIINLSSYPNETFYNSHVCFPMCFWLEYSSLIANNNGRAIQWHNKVVQAPGECRSPLDFWTDFAHSCNLDKYFAWKTEREFADQLLAQNALTRPITVENLDPEKNPPGGVLWPCIENEDLEFEDSRFIKGNVRGKNILFSRNTNYPFTKMRFPTLSGKINFFDQSKNRNPNKLSKEKNLFPLMLTTGVLVDYVEEFGYFVSDRNTNTKKLMIQIHPQTAKLIGIRNGEEITVENSRGSFTGHVWLKDDVDPRVIWCPEGIDQYQPYFKSISPLSLFELPASGLKSNPFTMVTIYKKGQDKTKTRQKLVKFLESLD